MKEADGLWLTRQRRHVLGQVSVSSFGSCEFGGYVLFCRENLGPNLTVVQTVADYFLPLTPHTLFKLSILFFKLSITNKKMS